MLTMPKYPIFIPSRGRSHIDLTTGFMRRDGVPFKLVVEPQEEKIYKDKFGEDHVIVLPENNRGLIYSRNWIKRYSTERGDERHWQIDDNISGIWRWYKGIRVYCQSGVAFRATEDFVDRYTNVAISGLNYVMFAVKATKPFVLNCHVYSCTLVMNSIPYFFREPANEDVDMCLQVLAGGYCTVLMNAFLAQKLGTMIVKGGQTDSAYRGDGRLFMARALERAWPGVVTVDRRFKRPQHVVKYSWQKFTNKLILKPGIDLEKLPPNEYGMRLVQKGDVVKSARLRRMLVESAEEGK